MGIFKPVTVLVDRHGREWRTAPGYQDSDPHAPGWLLMASTAGETLTYADVVDQHGFRNKGEMTNGKPYLIGYIEEEPS